jgi:hypothetical protein
LGERITRWLTSSGGLTDGFDERRSGDGYQ